MVPPLPVGQGKEAGWEQGAGGAQRSVRRELLFIACFTLTTGSQLICSLNICVLRQEKPHLETLIVFSK